jgi:hypothetical protein
MCIGSPDPSGESQCLDFAARDHLENLKNKLGMDARRAVGAP